MTLSSRRFPGYLIPIAVALIAFGLKAPSMGATDKPEAKELKDFVARARELLKAKDASGVKAMAVNAESLNWMEQKSFRGQTDWKLAPLAISSSSNLAVFYDFHTCESIGDHVHSIVKTADGIKFGPEIKESDTSGFRIRDHNLKVRYDLPKAGCTISDDLTIEKVDPKATNCLLRLSSDMTVDSASRNGKPFIVSSVPGLISFTAPASPTFTIQLKYHGTVSHPGSDYIKEGETVLCSYWYPHIGRLPAKHGVTVTVPKGWTAVGEGELLKRADIGSETTFKFRNEIPTCYFTLDAGPYSITSRMSNGRKLSVYELKPIKGRADRALDSLDKCLAWFEKNFGKYPYTHYEVVETLGPFGGALEAYSFSTYDRGAFGAVVHEVAHTWWGGIVPCPYTKSMWNESFASYSDGLFNRQTASTVPPKALTNQHRGNGYGRQMTRGFASPISDSFDTSNGAHASVGYGKGSLVLAMLEDTLGTKTMLSAMRQLNADHKPGEASEWPDFQKAVNKVTGKDYGWFFDQWINRGGVPLVKLTNVQKKEDSSGYLVTGEIVQEGAPYRLSMPVVIRGDGDNASTEMIDIAGASTTFKINVKFAPTAVELDPNGNILMAGAKTEDEKANPFKAAL